MERVSFSNLKSGKLKMSWMGVLAGTFLVLVSMGGCKTTDSKEMSGQKLNPSDNNSKKPITSKICPASRRFLGPTSARGETAAVRKEAPQNLNLRKLCSSERSAELKALPEGEGKTIASTLAILDNFGNAVQGDNSCPWLTMEFLELTHPSKWKKTTQTDSAVETISDDQTPVAGSQRKAGAVYDVIDARLISMLSRLKVLVIDGLDIVYPGELEKLKNIRHLILQNINLNSEDYFWIENLIKSKTLARLDFVSTKDDESVIPDLKIYFDEVGIQLQTTPTSESKFNTCLVRMNNDPQTCPNLKIISGMIPLRAAPSEKNTGKPLLILNEGDYLTRLENEGIFTKVKTVSKNPKVGFIRQEESKCIAKFINANSANPRP